MEVVRETEELLGKNEAYEAIYLEYRKYVDTEVQKNKRTKQKIKQRRTSYFSSSYFRRIGFRYPGKDKRRSGINSRQYFGFTK